MRRRLAIAAGSAFSVLCVALVLAVAGGLWVYHGPGPATADGKPVTVILRKGAGLGEIASSLEQGGAVRSASVFAAAAQITGAARHLKPGEYQFPSRASTAEVLEKVREGQIVRHLVTIPEGITSEMAVEILMNNPVLQGSVPVPPEGSILPETYDVERGEDRATVLKRLMDAQTRLMADLWGKRQKGLPFDTVEGAVTLASIVEKETAVASERPRIAAVFTNRLRQGVRLESDPTIIYGLTRGKPLGRGLRQSEMNEENAWNTYQINGLPPTPIANPGRASLAAVLDPPQTNELYFVANGTGGHVFASTYDEHLRNVARWRQIEARQAAQAASTETAGPPPAPSAAVR